MTPIISYDGLYWSWEWVQSELWFKVPDLNTALEPKPGHTVDGRNSPPPIKNHGRPLFVGIYREIHQMETVPWENIP